MGDRWFKVWIRMGLINGRYAVFNDKGDFIEKNDDGKMLLLPREGADQLVAGLNGKDNDNA